VRSNPRLSEERLREILHYDPETGEFRWLERLGYSIRVGDIAGCLNKVTGYRVITVCGRTYKAHQLAWLYMTGTWVRPTIDHRDLDRANNRWSNLRRATMSANGANRRRLPNNTSGFKGVHQDRQSGRWVARVRKDGQTHYLGRFATAQAAHEAYVAGAKRLFGEFARAE
jgi:hypothetical protein